MIPYKTEPEFILAENSEKISQQWVLSEISNLGYMDLVEDLAVLSKQLSMATSTFERIRDSVLALQLSPEALV